MKSLFKNIDALQIIGFLLSIALAFLLWNAAGRQEPISSITLGLVLAALTQGFDLQKRIKDSEERLLKANSLNQELQRNDWFHEQIQNIVSDYLSAKDV